MQERGVDEAARWAANDSRDVTVTADWQAQVRAAFRDPPALLSALDLTPEELPYAIDLTSDFAFLVPRAFAARMQPKAPFDPLLLQVLPRQDERVRSADERSDPVGDHAAFQGGGRIQKYEGRSLLITTGACAIACRYCFRREYDYAAQSLKARELAELEAYMRSPGATPELILSGGDPLSLGNAHLARLLDRVAASGRVRRLRIHTRMPVVLPDRIEPDLVALLADRPWRTVVVVHVNHDQELDASTAGALRRLSSSGATLLNQAVLLAGVNDSVEAQVELAERLFEQGVLPYYLHQLDRVPGSAHFAVTDRRARALHRQMRARLPGYLLPRLVREVPGASAKMPL